MTSPLTDTLPAGVMVSGTATTTCGGTPTAPSGGSVVTLTGGSIPAAGSCTITVPVTAPASGNFINSLPAGALQTNNGSNAGPAVATLSVTPPQTPSHRSARLLARPRSLRAALLPYHTLTNTSPDSASLTAPLIDHLPSGMEISGAGSDTCGGALTANIDTSIVTLTGGSIPADGSCTITVPVTTTGTGSYFNSIAAGDQDQQR